MLLIKTFPLSLAIFWRFMLVLPVWTLFYILLTALTFYGLLTLIGGIPVVGIVLLLIVPIIGTIVTYIISMHPYLIGIRIGLKVLGHPTEQSQHRLMVAAVGYGFIEGLIAVLISALFLALWLLAFESDFAIIRDLAHQRTIDPSAVLAQQIAYGRFAAMTTISAVVTLVLRAATLPALASAAAGRSRNGGPHKPFDGFGAKLPMMILLMLMITGVSTVALPLLGSGAQYLGLIQALVTKLDGVILFVTGKSQTQITLLPVFLIVCAISLSVWLFALQCAGAALSYTGGGSRPKPPASKLPPISSDEFGALRRGRMQNPPR